jgi:hypothetical protein
MNLHLRDNQNELDLHVHGGSAGDGDDQLSGIDDIIYDDVSAPAAPGSSKSRFYFVSGVPHIRVGASGADQQIAPDTKGDLITYSTVAAQLAVGTNAQGLLADSAQALGIKWGNIVQIKSGNYTGDGATSLAITGVGFAPKAVIIVNRSTSDAGGAVVIMTWTDIMDDNGSGGAININSTAIQFRTNEIISLDSDGFTVDDDGADAHPNSSSVVYNYVAFGP